MTDSLQITDKVTAVLKDIAVLQNGYKNARGRKALAKMVATAFKTTETLLKNVEAGVRAQVLSQYGIDVQRVTSPYAQWAAVYWGEKADGDKTVMALDGKEYPKWKPDTHMTRYFHTMHALGEHGFDQNSSIDAMVDWIIKEGGSQTVANKRQKSLSGNTDEKAEAEAQEHRDMFLQAGQSVLTGVEHETLKLPEETAEFFTLVCSKREDGSIAIHGVDKKDALAAMNKIAKAAYPALVDALAKEAMKARVQAKQNAKVTAPMEQTPAQIEARRITDALKSQLPAVEQRAV